MQQRSTHCIDDVRTRFEKGCVSVIAETQSRSPAAFALDLSLDLLSNGEVLCVLDSSPPYAEPEAMGLVVLRCAGTRNIAHYIKRKIVEKDWHNFAFVVIESAWRKSEDKAETMHELTRVADCFSVAIVVIAPSL